MNIDLRRADLVGDAVGIEAITRNAFAEALMVLGEGVATVRQVDRIMRDAVGLPLGPIELYLDRVNLDVLPSMRALADYRYDPAKPFRPSLPSPARAESASAAIQPDSAALVADLRPPCVWVAQAIPEWAVAMRDLVARAGVRVDLGQRPARDALIVVTPLGQDATTLCATQGLDPLRTVAVDCLFGLDRHRTVMATPLTSDDMLLAARGLFGADGTPVSVVRDSAGMVAQRIVAVLVNAACDIAQRQGLAAEDVDCAARLQLGYTFGPLALGDRIGGRRLLNLLETLQSCSGDPRYRPSPWLKRRALLGVSLLHGN